MYFPELQDDFWQSYCQIWQQEYELRQSRHEELEIIQELDPLEGLLEVSDLESVATQRRQAQLDIAGQHLLNPQLLPAVETSASTSGGNVELVASMALLDELPPELSACLVMAGGAVVDYLSGASQTDNIDFFLVTWSPQKVLQQVLSLWGDRVLSLTRSKTTVSAWVDVAPRPTAQQKLAQVEALLQQPDLTDAELAQAIRRLLGQYQPRYVLMKFALQRWLRPVEVLLDFDLECCRCLYYQGKFYATGSCLLALRHSLNVVDLSRASSTYNQRLRKYARRGFHVLISPRLVTVTAVHLRAALVPGLTSRVGWSFEGHLVGLLALFFRNEGPAASPPQSEPPQLTGYSVECQQGKVISYSYPVANYGLGPLLERPAVIATLYSSLKWGPSPRLEFLLWRRCGYAIKRWIKLPSF